MAAEQPERVFGVVHRVERDDRLEALAVGLLVQVGGVLLLDVRGVAQHDRAERGRGGRGVDRAAVALARERGQVAAVVDVRVGKDHGIETADVEREAAVDLARLLAAALEQPAVAQDPRAVDFEEMLGAGHRVHAAEKMDFHRLDFFLFRRL